jgi:hypothetical protein
MTREEAIAVLRREIEPSVYEDEKSIAEALNMAIEALQEVQKHEETFEWCHDCKEYDKENHSCPRWSKVIRNTVEELKADTVSREEYDELYRKAKEVNEMANDILADFPSYKELVSVVRCKDCRWYRDTFLDTKITPTCDRHIDDRYGTLVGGITGESFCSYGERKEP